MESFFFDFPMPEYGHSIQYAEFDLTCSDGEYQVDVRTSQPGEVVDSVNNVVYTTRMLTSAFGGVMYISDYLLSDIGGYSGYFDFGEYNVASFEIGSYLRPLDGVNKNLPDTYSYTANIIFTIEKQ